MIMEIKQKYFKDHFLSYVLIPLIVIIIVASYHRFIVDQNYLVEYESTCDSSMEKCFVGCEDDSCIKEYYYSKMVKYASDLERKCGKDITDCEAANACLPDDRKCSITYCDPGISENNCSTPVEKSNTQSDSQGGPTKEESLQTNNTSNINI